MNNRWKQKENHKRILKKGLVLLAAGLLFLGGCTPTKYTKQEENSTVSVGMRLLEEYLSKNNGATKPEDVDMLTGSLSGQSVYSGYYASDCVQGSYMLDGERHEIAVNVKTGDIYTDLLVNPLKECLEKRLREELLAEGWQGDVCLEYITLEREILCKNEKDGETEEVLVVLENLLPEEMTKEQLPGFVNQGEQDFCLSSATILFHRIEDDDEAFIRGVQNFCKNSGLLHEGCLYFINLYEEDFEAIKSGSTEYDWRMKRIDNTDVYIDASGEISISTYVREADK